MHTKSGTVIAVFDLESKFSSISWWRSTSGCFTSRRISNMRIGSSLWPDGTGFLKIKVHHSSRSILQHLKINLENKCIVERYTSSECQNVKISFKSDSLWIVSDFVTINVTLMSAWVAVNILVAQLTRIFLWHEAVLHQLQGQI